MAIVSAIARIDTGSTASIRHALCDIAGVSDFDSGDPQQLGILIEGENLNVAHDTLRQQVEAIPGVMCVWPVFASIEDELETHDPQPA